METVTRNYQVYDFKELSKEAKYYAIEKWYENEDYPFLEDYIQEELHQLDEHEIFEDIKLQYSLSYCQGDGLSFSAHINLKNFLDNIYSKKLQQFKKDTIQNYIYKCYSKGNTGHYCYASKSDIEYYENYQNGIERKYIDILWQDILEEIKKYYMNICNNLEKYGYSILEYRMNDEEFSEFCEDNEYKFFENGKMFNL